MNKSDTRTIEVFRPGTFKPMNDAPITYSADDLRTIAANYDAADAPTPAVIGHPRTNHPAYGWAKGFRYDEEGGRLLADIGELEPHFADAVAQGRYKKVSLSFFRPDSSANPKPGTWYPRHIGFLGAAAPAVSGLKPVQFAERTDDFVEFGLSESSVASLFRRMRDFLISEFGQEKADAALPGYEIQWLTEDAIREEVGEGKVLPSFSDPVTPKPETPMPKTNPAADPAAAAREAELAAREAALAERERSITHDRNVSFAESLIGDGKLLPVHQERMVAVLDAIDGGTDTVSFADGKTAAPADELRAILKELPKTVPLGRSKPEGGIDDSPAFAAPERMDVSGDRLDLHRQALAYQRQNRDVSYAEAVKAVETGL